MMSRALILIVALFLMIGFGVYTGKSLVTFQTNHIQSIEKALAQ